MSRRVAITPTAEADLDDILHFIAVDNPAAARRFVTTLRARMKTLARMPERCPRAPEDGLDGLEIRHLITSGYRILFTVDADLIVILQVRHGARLPATED
ncbi:plasmid stabilization protein [Iodidimonas muriae]|uniref:Plasmid stabilization protein n=1 Tax=Iodidimonas muriae TaxID=261467 RepID=A0ABQ2LGP5_9PROT|nr:type II toxin-antitoxin system RelE/ParE family toxin [Iodidimonas muriae]GER08860.1 plasmid stabilization protein [Kordiimonadales bacterium JCM 17843]GGO16152.1 plasmid stabilization protein [Iodidimonas muriae]